MSTRRVGVSVDGRKGSSLACCRFRGVNGCYRPAWALAHLRLVRCWQPPERQTRGRGFRRLIVRASRPPWRRPATAKSVIFLFMEGGPSHLDLFDPKPELNRLAGQPLPPSFKPVITPMGEGRSPLLASKRKWKQHGQSGIWVSDWLPHIATCVDDLAVIRSCWSNGLNHVGGVCQMNTGSMLAGRPSLGSWVSYGLGTENQNLPASS